MASSAFLKSLARDFARKNILVPHLENWFAAGKFPDEIPFKIHPNKEQDDAFHPSSSTKCARLLYALREEHVEKEKFTGTSHKNFMVGHYYHALIQLIVQELGFSTEEDIEREFYFSDTAEKRTHPGFKTAQGNPYDVRGFVDIATCTVPNKGTYLVDIKTMNSRYFAMQELPYDTWVKYQAQVQLYLEFMGLDEAILLCAQKDTPHGFKEFMIYRDGDAVDAIFDRWESVVDAQAQGMPPDCTCEEPGKCPVLEVYNGALSRS